MYKMNLLHQYISEKPSEHAGLMKLHDGLYNISIGLLVILCKAMFQFYICEKFHLFIRCYSERGNTSI